MSALHWPTGPERDFVAVGSRCTTMPPTTNRVINRTISKGFNGAGNRIRTRDPLITNQVLYQLSYTGNGLAISIEAPGLQWGAVGFQPDRPGRASSHPRLAGHELFFCHEVLRRTFLRGYSVREKGRLV